MNKEAQLRIRKNQIFATERTKMNGYSNKEKLLKVFLCVNGLRKPSPSCVKAIIRMENPSFTQYVESIFIHF